MGVGQKRNAPVVQQASQALYNFKYEIAQEIGIANKIQGGYWGYLSSRDCGAVGGHMVRKMVQMAEQSLAGTTGTTAGQQPTT